MTTFLVAHGAWSAGWSWKKMRPLLSAMGHILMVPTYTGVGERIHLAGPGVDLDTHISDMLNVLFFEDLHDIALVGHSYGGMVATAVADRQPERIARLIYIDAFVPRNGQSLLDLHSEAARRAVHEAALHHGQGWQVPPNPLPPDTSPEDVAWISPRRVMQPLGTMTQPVQLNKAGRQIPTAYIYCKRTGPMDVFQPFARRAQRESGWRYYEIDASHSPHVTAPEILAELLNDIVTGKSDC
jgi:pimeloyl-ACP methyl ester carboxylesterase